MGFRSLPFSFVFKPNDSVTAEAVAYINKMVDVRERKFSRFLFYLVDGLVCCFNCFFCTLRILDFWDWWSLLHWGFHGYFIPLEAAFFHDVHCPILCIYVQLCSAIIIVHDYDCDYDRFTEIVGLHPVFELLVALVFLASSTFLKFPLFQEKQRFAEVL